MTAATSCALSDLEITRLCAEAMGVSSHFEDRTAWRTIDRWLESDWRPLHDDAQAMALVKTICLTIHRVHFEDEPSIVLWRAGRREDNLFDAINADLNRAICLCVARRQGT